MSILRLRSVTYAYPQADRPALREVSFDLQPGEFCVLAGLSGSGKSTVLRAAAGLIPHFHGGEFSGDLSVCGLSTREGGPAAFGLRTGTVLQDPESQVIMSTVRAELALALENSGARAAQVARGVEETALALGIPHLLDRPTRELSGGECQRVALAAALVTRPPLVLLDEPTSQLDPVAGDELIWQLRRLNQEADTAVLLVEHRLERCLAAADRVIALRDGELACDSDPRGFLKWAAAEEPALLTPAAELFAAARIDPPPAGVKQARAALRTRGLLDDGHEPAANAGPAHASPAGFAPAEPASAPTRPRPRRRFRRERRSPALSIDGLWHELRSGPALLRGVDLELEPGETVVLMGRNGAGKSTLLRQAAGLLEPTRGSVAASGRVALLLQNPGDYLIRERVAEEAGPAALAAAGLAGLGERHPRDLSGGQRQRLALAAVLDGPTPAVLALDEPTRGMDRAAKRALAARLRELAAGGPAVLVATHDAEFASELASRALLMSGGRLIADGPVGELLCGGWYFATETARILQTPGALTPRDGAELLRARAHAGVAEEAPAPAAGGAG